MKIYYDTEFIEDGKTIELISIGMAAQDGRELYAVNSEITTGDLYTAICKHQWLMENVVPHLPLAPRKDNLPQVVPPKYLSGGTMSGRFDLDTTHRAVLPRWVIRNQVRQFITETPEPELWAWFGAYDHVALAQLFGPMVNLPLDIPMWTNDLRQEMARLKVYEQRPCDVSTKHNALFDARQVKIWDEWLTEIQIPADRDPRKAEFWEEVRNSAPQS